MEPKQKFGKELTQMSLTTINTALLQLQEDLSRERRQRQLQAVAINRAVAKIRLLIGHHDSPDLEEIDEILSPFVSKKLKYGESDDGDQ